MIRDFVAGVIWGGVVAGVGLGVVSQVAAPPARQAEQAAPVTAGSEAAAPETVVAPKAAADAVEVAPPATAEVAETPDETNPEPSAAADAPKAEVPAVGAAEPSSPAEPPVAPEPADKPAEVAVQEPAPTPAPDPAEGPAAPQAEGAAPPAPVASTQPPLQTAEAAPKADGAPGEGVLAGLPGPTPAEPEEKLLTPQPDAAPQAPAVAEVPGADPAVDPGAAGEATPMPEAAEAEVPAPKAGQTDSASGVTVGRLPTITPEASETVIETGVGTVTPAEAMTPLDRFSRSFDPPVGKPLFAILLVDPGTPDVDRAALAALPFPVTFVVDPFAPGAAEAMAIYRAAGQEVAIFGTGIPNGAKAADVEQTFQSHATALPETVAVVDPGEGGFQADRQMSAALVDILKAQGRGLITFDQGLNAADQVARREDLPAATIFRTLDDEGEDTPVIRRYLDRAAFKAAQEGRVMVLGTARPETVAALLEWSVEGRAASVALAPASALMTAE